MSIEDTYAPYFKSNKPAASNQGIVVPVREITFSLVRADGSVSEIVKHVTGDNEMVEWVTTQFAEANECGCIATFNGEQIATHGNVQQ